MHEICELHQEPLKREMEFRVKTLNRSEKCIQPHSLQVIACSSLCELSENICTEESSERSKDSKPSLYTHHNYSPWKLKKEEITLQPQIARMKKNLKSKANANAIRYNSTISSEGKQNINFTRVYKNGKEEIEPQKQPSIFMRIRAAKETKTDISKKQKSETEIITIMKRKRPTNKEELQSKKVILIEQIEEHSKNLRLFNKKIEDLQIIKKYSVNSIKNLPSCLVELEPENTNKQSVSSKPVKTVIDYWKTRRLSIKNKKSKNLHYSRQTKSIQRKENKQNILISKKASLSLEKAYREDYQSSNPLTRLLYEKYINTISIHQPKQQNFHFL